MFSSQSFGVSGSQAASQDMGATPDAKRAKQEEKLTCLPVTLCMVEAAMAQSKHSDDGAVRFHNTEPGMILLVGLVESLEQQAASLEFSFNDTTGRMRARHYTNEHDGALEGVAAGKYVSMAAQLRTSPFVHLSVTSMQVVRSADELSYHMIEAAHAALKLRAGPSMKKMGLSTPEKLPVPPKRDYMDVSPPAAPVISVAPTPQKGSQALQGTALSSAVVTFMKERGEVSEEGVTVIDVCTRLAPAARADIVSLLQKLVADGEAYNTIDDDHFAAL